MKNKKTLYIAIIAIFVLAAVIALISLIANRSKPAPDPVSESTVPEASSSVESQSEESDEPSEFVSNPEESGISEESEPASEESEESIEESVEESDITEESSEESEEVSEESEEPVSEECEHEYDAGEASAFPTCKDEGEMVYTCVKCGETKTEAIPKTTTHKYDSGKVTKEATCTEKGIKTYTCTVCGATKTEEIEKTEHKYDSGTVTKQATCEENGSKVRKCTVCGHEKTETISKTGHDYDNGVVTKEATTKESGIKTYTCKKCGKTKTETIPRIGSDPNEKASEYGEEYPITINKTEKMKTCSHKGSHCDKIVIKEATCVDMLQITHFTCRDCGYKFIKTQDMNGNGTFHVIELTVLKEATCTEWGRNKWKCKLCGFEEIHDIPNADHEYVYDHTEHFDEPHESYDIVYEKCKHCGYVNSFYGTQVHKSDHNFVVYAENKTPTENVPSYKIMYCPMCDDWYAEGEGQYADGTKVRLDSSSYAKEDFWRIIDYGESIVHYSDYGINIRTLIFTCDDRTNSSIEMLPKVDIKVENGIVKDMTVKVSDKGAVKEYHPDFNDIISKCSYIPNSIVFHIDDNGVEWLAGESGMNGPVPAKIK